MLILIFTIFSGLSITITLMHHFIFQKNVEAGSVV